MQSHLTGWMERLGVRAQTDAVTNAQLLERAIRVEEDLRAGREIMIIKFEALDRRFESIDLRIGDLIESLDDRYGRVIQNIGVVKWFVVTSFLVIGGAISLLAVLQ